MAVVGQRALIETLSEKVESVEELYPGYRNDLRDHLTDIVVAERENQERAINIQQKVTAKTQALGALILRNKTQPNSEG